MSKARSAGKNSDIESSAADERQAIPSVPAPALLSFLKQVGAVSSWDARHLASILNLKADDAPQIIATLEMLGYAEPVSGKKGLWRNTPAGNTVAGVKPARFNRERVIEALADLRTRAEHMNADTAAPFRATELIAFGDFLDDHDKVQAADVAVRLAAKHRDEPTAATALEHKREEQVLSDLKAKSSMLHLHLIEDWMRKRSHQAVFR